MLGQPGRIAAPIERRRPTPVTSTVPRRSVAIEPLKQAPAGSSHQPRHPTRAHRARQPDFRAANRPLPPLRERICPRRDDRLRAGARERRGLLSSRPGRDGLGGDDGADRIEVDADIGGAPSCTSSRSTRSVPRRSIACRLLEQNTAPSSSKPAGGNGPVPSRYQGRPLRSCSHNPNRSRTGSPVSPAARPGMVMKNTTATQRPTHRPRRRFPAATSRRGGTRAPGKVVQGAATTRLSGRHFGCTLRHWRGRTP